MGKASLESLNALHDAVARSLMSGLDDPKILSAAIKFLKDNDITADLMTDDSNGNSLGKAIKEHLDAVGGVEKLSVEAMMDMAS